MDEKKKPVNGPFTQVPNVFFDTCNLPETAQILYLRLLRKFGYIGGTFTGSIRELAKIVRYSKSTTDRLIKVLRDADLIRIEYDTEGNMTIVLNTSDLWALNKHHYEVQPSQIWDSKLPSVPEMGQTSPRNGTLRGSQNRDAQNVPEMGQDQAQSQAPKEREEKKERMKESDSSIHSSILSLDTLEKIAQVTRDCSEEDVASQVDAIEHIYYQNEDMSEDEFYGFLFHAETAMRRGPKTMDRFFEYLDLFLKQRKKQKG